MVTKTLHVLRACLVFLFVVELSGGNLRAADDDDRSAIEMCTASSPHVPPTVAIARELRGNVEQMLLQSATFREQCRRMAEAPRLHVIVRVNPQIPQTICRARSVIQHTASGFIIATVEIGPWGSPVPWIAHEFEHLLEQLEGIRLDALAGRASGVWRTTETMFETERAIRAGLTVSDEMRRKDRQSDKLVE